MTEKYYKSQNLEWLLTTMVVTINYVNLVSETGEGMIREPAAILPPPFSIHIYIYYHSFLQEVRPKWKQEGLRPSCLLFSR